MAWVGFLVRECLVGEVEFITSVEYEESVWMKVRGGRGRSALYVGCVYMPTDSTSVAAVDASYVRLKEDVPTFRLPCGRYLLALHSEPFYSLTCSWKCSH